MGRLRVFVRSGCQYKMLNIKIPAVTFCLICRTIIVLSDNDWTMVQVPDIVSVTTNTHQYPEYQPPAQTQEAYQALPVLSQHSTGDTYQQPPLYQTPQADYIAYQTEDQIYQHPDGHPYQQLEGQAYQQLDGQAYQNPDPIQYYGEPHIYDAQYSDNGYQPYPSVNGQQPVYQPIINEPPKYPQQVQTYPDPNVHENYSPEIWQYQNLNLENQPPEYPHSVEPQVQSLAQTPTLSRSDTVSSPSKLSNLWSKLREFVQSFISTEARARSDSGFAAILSLSSIIIGSILYI